MRLSGVDDGTARIRLGVLRVANAGALLTFAAETGTGADPSPWYQANLNETGKAIDFGDLRTDGSAWLHLDAHNRGLGTRACGPDTLPQYRIGASRYEFGWWIRSFTPGDASRP